MPRAKAVFFSGFLSVAAVKLIEVEDCSQVHVCLRWLCHLVLSSLSSVSNILLCLSFCLLTFTLSDVKIVAQLSFHSFALRGFQCFYFYLSWFFKSLSFVVNQLLDVVF